MTADNQMGPILRSWLKDTTVTPPDANRSVSKVMDGLPEVSRQRRWWLPSLRRRTTPASPAAIPDPEYHPSPIPATNGHSPTVIGRTQSMFSPAKAITAGALVFAIGGVLLIAQPFYQQGGGVPGAATDGDRPAIEKVTGQFVSIVGGDEPDMFFGTSPDGNAFYRNAVSVGAVEMSDERLSGEVTFTVNNDYAGSGIDPVEAVINWGSVSIENDAGAWTGTRTYVYLDVEEPLVEYWELVGSDAYEGWSTILFGIPGTEVEVSVRGNDSVVYGAVFSGNLPPDRESYIDCDECQEG